MAKRLQHRGGTTSQHSSFTGAVREVTVDTDKNTLVVHDGATAGGHPLATATNFKSTGIDDNATSTAITIDSSERVGIGTSSPVSDAKLTISSDDTESYIFFERSGSNKVDTAIGNNNGRTVIKGGSDSSTVGGLSEYMTILSSGNVGIGTSSPTSELEVYGASTPKITVKSGNGTSASIKLQRLNENDTSTDFELKNIGGELKIIADNSAQNEYETIILSATGHKYFTNNTERMRIDSIGNVGIGTSSPTDTNGFGKALDIQGSTGGAIYVGSSGDRGIFGYTAGQQHIVNPSATGTTRFTINGTERMRIDSSGNVLFGKTTTNFNTAGHNMGGGASLELVRSGGAGLNVNRLTSDGSLVDFWQAGSNEGSISVSGSTVSYNGFTGTHWSRFTDNSTPTILKGTVLETLDEMCDWYNLHFDITTTTQDEDGNDVTNTVTEKVPHVLTDSQSNGDVITYNHKGTDYQATIVKENDVKHMMSKVSDTVDAKNVYGLFVAYDNDGEGYNDFYVASVGSFVVRIKANETIAKGDLLQSNGDGTAKVQSDDNVKSSSFAKVLSTTIIETYEDGSYLVPCSLMC